LTELHRPALLERKHDRTRLDSGAPSLDRWLREQAGQGGRANTARTWVIADADHVVVAYASMSLSAVDASAAPRALKAGSLPHVPALLCGRLAVDQRFRGLGLGAALVRLVLSKAIEVNATAACRAVVVHALDQEARGFWERFGFHPFTDDPGEQDLYLLTSEIEQTLGGLLDQ
jgi:GNAT superfamily N-acetyltransferase